MIDTISKNLSQIQQRMSSAQKHSDRAVEEVELVAVTKYAKQEWVEALVELDQIKLGESRPQQLSERFEAFPDHIQWHMIGHLQRNKVRPVLETGAIIHSVDSERLLERIETIASDLNVTVDVFIEVNISGEESKYGFRPEEAGQVLPLLCECPHVTPLGLMTMAPYSDNPEDARPYFQQLRELQNDLNAQLDQDHQMTCLSMGMSGDFEVAIAEGATHIRIGSALFEGLSES